MGFVSVNLEGKEIHETLLCRQDSELRLLEMMKRCISSKVKHDREYAAALSSVAMQGLKVDKYEYMKESNILKAWKVMMEELDNLGRLFRSNADIVEKETLEKLSVVAQEKRKAKKHHQDEYSRLCSQFLNLSEEVTKKRTDYYKYLEDYRQMRSRFEEHYIKSGRGGRKLEEVREKYQRACRRLHQVHNEYVLLIADAQETQRDFNVVLLPCLLQQQQNLFQDFTSSWQNILKEIIQCWNVPAVQFTQCYSNAENIVKLIKPMEEYKMLMEKQNGLICCDKMDFKFDTHLVDDTTGRLQPNQLAVDNLTVDWVRKKLTDLEATLKECQTSISNCDKIKDSCIDLSLSELRSKERKLSRQIEVIRKALSEIGCEELPNVCDLENSFERGNDVQPLNRVSLKRASLSALNQHTTATATAPESIVDKLWKPFRRKSAPNSPVMSRLDGLNPQPPSSGVCFDDHINSNDCSLFASNLDINQYFTNTLGSSMRSLVDEEWFHGVLPRDEVVRLLTKEGDFLVRETTRNDENQTVLSVLWGGRDKHFIVQTTSDGEFRFEGPSFPTIQELTNYQFQSGSPVTSRSGAILKHPILRERWELNNDDVHLIQKIGKGNFGDVYKARLIPSNRDVAVKTCRVTVPEEYKKKFLQEGRILKQYDHPNIVKFIGICVQKQPIMIVMELVPGGSLSTFLRKNASSLAVSQLMLMCRDTAAGMCYLESKNCIHRDLAARNCLVGDDNIVKISDFGMSREEEEYIVSDGMKQIPIKWTAPEALNFGKYTSLCDVWSYGVLMWEIFSRGENPYPGLSNSEAREKIDAGYRMPAPDCTPEEMYKLMLKCWEYQAEKRPHFDQIYRIVEVLVNSYS